jgi:hypothetical protein
MKSRVTIRKEIMELYLHEKDVLYKYFQTLNCHMSATIDMWSNQNKGYMLAWWKCRLRYVTKKIWSKYDLV